jgi:hypothetical protein
MRTIGMWAARMVGVLASVALASCAGVRTTYLADGTRGYSVSCRGFLNTWDSCLVKAGRICGMRGYDTIEGDKYDRSLLIGCKSNGTAGK